MKVNLSLSEYTVRGAIATAVTLAVIYGSLIILRRYFFSRITDPKKRYSANKISFYAATFLSIVVLSLLWLSSLANAAMFVSAVGAGGVFALHQMLLNIAGWLILMVRRLYRPGDRVQIGQVKGDVIDVSLFWTTLLEVGEWVEGEQSTGRIVACPNRSIFTQNVFNYTQGFNFIWNEISVIITFESNWRAAKQIITDIAYRNFNEEVKEQVERQLQAMSRRYMIYYRHLTPIVYTTIADYGVKLTLRYLTEAHKRRSSEVEISTQILDAFSEREDVELAYPTYRIYRRGES
jgi:small-conductance mechanosensitive channel